MFKEEFFAELEKLDLQYWETSSPHHKQILKNGKPIINWWPGKGTTQLIGGQIWRCKSHSELIEWIKKKCQINLKNTY